MLDDDRHAFTTILSAMVMASNPVVGDVDGGGAPGA